MNIAWHQMKPVSDRNEDESGAALLMSAFLEMYDHWRNASPGSEPPSEWVNIAADTCVLMRNELQKQERSEWTAEAEGLFQMMVAFMFLFTQVSEFMRTVGEDHNCTGRAVNTSMYARLRHPCRRRSCTVMILAACVVPGYLNSET